jgi:hypothetical protein
MKHLKKNKLSIVVILALIVAMTLSTAAFALEAQDDGKGIRIEMMSDENGTRYSIDGGKTWTTEIPMGMPEFGADEDVDVSTYSITVGENGEIIKVAETGAIFGSYFLYDGARKDISLTIDIVEE